MTYSANLGFLWTDLPFLDRIDAAARAGFEALEFHDHAQAAERSALKARLRDVGLPVVGLNSQMGPTAGVAVAADPRSEITAAADVAQDIGAGAIHVIAGAADKSARVRYLDGLELALEIWEGTVLIEPLCRSASPGYHLWDIKDAAAIIDEIGNERLKIMFDCFHVMDETGDVAGTYQQMKPKIGHVQIASHPARAEPETGPNAAIDYAQLLPFFREEGFAGPFGCEYRPAGTVEAGLGWRDQIR